MPRNNIEQQRKPGNEIASGISKATNKKEILVVEMIYLRKEDGVKKLGRRQNEDI